MLPSPQSEFALPSTGSWLPSILISTNSKFAHKKGDILSEKLESGMALKSVSLRTKEIMLTHMNHSFTRQYRVRRGSGRRGSPAGLPGRRVNNSGVRQRERGVLPERALLTGECAHLICSRPGNVGVVAISLWDFGNSVYPTLPVYFGRDTKSRWSLLSGVYARRSKRSHQAALKCVTVVDSTTLTSIREGLYK